MQFFESDKKKYALAMTKPRAEASPEEISEFFTDPLKHDDAGLEVVAIIRIKQSGIIPERMYERDHRNLPDTPPGVENPTRYYGRLQELFCNPPNNYTYAYVLKARDTDNHEKSAIDRVRSINGKTKTWLAEPNTIRGTYGKHHQFRTSNAETAPTDGPILESGMSAEQQEVCATENIVHAPDSVRNFGLDLAAILGMVKSRKAEFITGREKLSLLQGLAKSSMEHAAA